MPDQPAAQPAPLSRDARIRELESKVERLSRAMADLKVPPSSPPPPPPSAAPAEPAAREPDREIDPLRGIVVSGYVQAQLENHDESEDQLRPGGAPLNQNRFLIRRGRLKVEREWQYSSLLVEIDGNTTRGPAMQLFRAEASLLWRGENPVPAPPLVKLTAGIFDVPFGYELTESSRSRFFTERSVQSRAFFPAEPDLGVRLGGEIGWFRYALAFMNGEPLGEPGFPAQDPNNHKDFAARIGAVAAPVKEAEISGGVSVLNGKGFVKGADATKSTVVWVDANEDHKIQDGEILPVPASAASPAYNFDRWAVGADLQVRFRTDLGWTKVYGELQLGSNMDRALFIANPAVGGQNTRELGYYWGVVQDVTPYGVVGFRSDFYDPNADFLGFQSGKVVPVSETVRTFSPLLGLVLAGRARLVFEYDFIRDHFGRDNLGVPTDLKNDAWTLRLQGEL